MQKVLKNKAQIATEAALRFYAHTPRELPWRKTHDAYAIFLSEVMLQQTQVHRVVPKFEAFLARFPTWETLATASFSDVLRLFQGLGYNRRAKYLQDAARMVVREYNGVLPKDLEKIEALPGVGHYTARAIAAFAFNEGYPLVETNIRTVYMHHCFPRTKKVSDAQILACVGIGLSDQDPRVLYSALMDYGAHLKARGISLNARSSHYVKQKAFNGSLRQVRGALMKQLLEGPSSEKELAVRLKSPHTKAALAALVREGMLKKNSGRYALV